MLEEEGKSYPVQFVCYAGKHTHIHSEMCIILLTLDEKRKKKSRQKSKNREMTKGKKDMKQREVSRKKMHLPD